MKYLELVQSDRFFPIVIRSKNLQLNLREDLNLHDTAESSAQFSPPSTTIIDLNIADS